MRGTPGRTIRKRTARTGGEPNSDEEEEEEEAEDARGSVEDDMLEVAEAAVVGSRRSWPPSLCHPTHGDQCETWGGPTA